MAKNEFQRLRNVAKGEKRGRLKGKTYVQSCRDSHPRHVCSVMDSLSTSKTQISFYPAPLPPPLTKDMGKHEVCSTAVDCILDSR